MPPLWNVFTDPTVPHAKAVLSTGNLLFVWASSQWICGILVIDYTGSPFSYHEMGWAARQHQRGCSVCLWLAFASDPPILGCLPATGGGSRALFPPPPPPWVSVEGSQGALGLDLLQPVEMPVIVEHGNEIQVDYCDASLLLRWFWLNWLNPQFTLE